MRSFPGKVVTFLLHSRAAESGTAESSGEKMCDMNQRLPWKAPETLILNAVKTTDLFEFTVFISPRTSLLLQGTGVYDLEHCFTL